MAEHRVLVWLLVGLGCASADEFAGCQCYFGTPRRSSPAGAAIIDTLVPLTLQVSNRDREHGAVNGWE